MFDTDYNIKVLTFGSDNFSKKKEQFRKLCEEFLSSHDLVMRVDITELPKSYCKEVINELNMYRLLHRESDVKVTFPTNVEAIVHMNVPKPGLDKKCLAGFHVYKLGEKYNDFYCKATFEPKTKNYAFITMFEVKHMRHDADILSICDAIRQRYSKTFQNILDTDEFNLAVQYNAFYREFGVSVTLFDVTEKQLKTLKEVCSITHMILNNSEFDVSLVCNKFSMKEE